jgi:hypothetical protein
MLKKLPVLFSTLFMCLAVATGAFGFGEEILALKGEYTFFISPDPGSCRTYYQRMVPCIARPTVMVPRKTVQVFPVPMVGPQPNPIWINERPVGCAEGAGPCVECTPKPLCYPGMKGVGPVPVPVRVETVVYEPKCVARPVMLPQWFEVTESPRDRKPVRKVGAGG